MFWCTKDLHYTVFMSSLFGTDTRTQRDEVPTGGGENERVRQMVDVWTFRVEVTVEEVL